MDKEQKVMYPVPRPVRSPRTLGGLTGKGLIFFCLSSLFFGVGSWIVTGMLIENFWALLATRVPLFAVVLGLSYVLFKVDEESGEMEFEIVTDFLSYKAREKVVSPEWEGTKRWV